MIPIVTKLVTYAAYEGHSCNSARVRLSDAETAGTRTSRMSSVIAIAKTPSLNASSLEVLKRRRPRFRRSRGGDRNRRLLESDAQHVAHVVDEMERHLLTHRLGHVVEIGPVACRQHHFGEPGAMGGQHLLLHAADRKHASLQRHLAG